MKTFIGLMLFAMSSAFAAEMIVIDVPAKGTMKADSHSAKFVIDEETGTGKAVLSVTRSDTDCDYGSDHPRCTTTHYNILTERAAIVGIDVVDKKVTFEDRVDCGKMGVSRVFKVPTFYMSGNCKLEVERVKVNGEKRIQVKLVTKE